MKRFEILMFRKLVGSLWFQKVEIDLRPIIGSGGIFKLTANNTPRAIFPSMELLKMVS